MKRRRKRGSSVQRATSSEQSSTKCRESKKASADPKGKPSVPCLFYPKGTCNRGPECPFAHVDQKSAAKEKPSKAAPVAIATVATVLASSASQAAGAPTSNASAFVSALRYAFAPFRFLLCLGMHLLLFVSCCPSLQPSAVLSYQKLEQGLALVVHPCLQRCVRSVFQLFCRLNMP